jgi:hypothetical protein
MRTRTARILGTLLLAQFLFVCAHKLARGVAVELFWMSHACLLLAALGLLLRKSWLVGAALTGIGVLHTLWVIDAVAWLLTGEYPLTFANYLHDLDALGWVGTSHHFYLAPLLLWVVIRERNYTWAALATTMAVYAALTVFSRFALPEADNVNRAWQIAGGPRLALADWVNGLPLVPYLLVLNLLTTAFVFLPVALPLWAWSAFRPPRQEQPVPSGYQP